MCPRTRVAGVAARSWRCPSQDSAVLLPSAARNLRGLHARLVSPRYGALRARSAIEIPRHAQHFHGPSAAPAAVQSFRPSHQRRASRVARPPTRIWRSSGADDGGYDGSKSVEGFFLLAFSAGLFVCSIPTAAHIAFSLAPYYVRVGGHRHGCPPPTPAGRPTGRSSLFSIFFSREMPSSRLMRRVGALCCVSTHCFGCSW
jgi:hypothetical protein